MNKEKNDVFTLQNPHFCQEHHKLQYLICLDPDCSLECLTCIDCLVEKHQECKSHMSRYSEFILQQTMAIKQKQEQKKKLFCQLSQQYETLQDLQVKFNQLFFQLEKNFSQILTQLSYEEENEQLSILFGQNKSKELELLNQLAKKKYFEESDYSSKQTQLYNQTNEIIKMTQNMIDKYYKPESVIQQVIQDSDEKYLKIQSLQELKLINTQITKFRLEIFHGDWTGFQDYICKFTYLLSIQINASKSQLSSKELDMIIQSLQYLPNLEKLNINLVGSKANDQTLKTILNVVFKKKLKEFGILFAFSEIMTPNFMDLILSNVDSLKGVKKLYFSNQLNEFTEAQEKQLKQKLSQIEFMK